MKKKKAMIETNIGWSFEAQVKKIEKLLDDGFIIDIPAEFKTIDTLGKPKHKRNLTTRTSRETRNNSIKKKEEKRYGL